MRKIQRERLFWDRALIVLHNLQQDQILVQVPGTSCLVCDFDRFCNKIFNVIVAEASFVGSLCSLATAWKPETGAQSTENVACLPSLNNLRQQAHLWASMLPAAELTPGVQRSAAGAGHRA